MKNTFGIYDTAISVASEDATRDPAPEPYRSMLNCLEGQGFKVGKNPRIERDYPILSTRHNGGSHGSLEFESERYPAGCKIEFFQNIVFENPNGGRYDFDKLDKMPYLVRLRFTHAIRALRNLLLERGFIETTKVRSPNPDPLAYFNSIWDSSYEITRGTHRFVRGADGWPSDQELNIWSRKDRDGNILSHGDIRWFRDYKGRVMRCRVYGGINGMWMAVYGPGKNDCTQKSAGEFFAFDPSIHPRKQHPNRMRRLEDAMKKAVETKNFEKAIVFRDLIEAESVQ